MELDTDGGCDTAYTGGYGALGRAARGGPDGANRSWREMDINVAARKDIPKTETEIGIETPRQVAENAARVAAARGVAPWQIPLQ